MARSISAALAKVSIASAAVLAVALLASTAAYAHSLDVAFDPAANRVSVTAALDLPPETKGGLVLTLTPGAAIAGLTSGGAPVRYTRSGETVRPRLPAGAKSLTLAYALTLNSPPKNVPASMDNPGAVAGDAVSGEDWAMLMPGSLWHPEIEGAANAYRIVVAAPQGISAVTQGTLVGREDREAGTVSVWDVPRPVGRLGLCLARYEPAENRSGPVPALSFLLAPSRALADVYLAASAKYLDFYSRLHGPYAFSKFAVVENPLPTGYGLPSYTLLGSSVLALPFIPQTSLRHEIAHNWWGNGVLIDQAGGNWCEGLTTYVADYLSREEVSPDEARAYRLRALRGFAELAGQGADMPLTRFTERFSPASQAVGYAKAMFVFHMLRGIVGDAAFWDGLRELYRTHLLKPASWEDIRRVFAGKPGFGEAESRTFFSQWLTRTGGPVLRLDKIESAPMPEGGYAVAATVSQAGRPYLLGLALEITTASGSVTRRFILSGPSARISMDVPDKPVTAALDPQADCFRQLSPGEVPASVNSVKAGSAPLVVVAEGAPPSLQAALPALLAGLGRENAKVVPEAALAGKPPRGNILVVGTPRAAIPGLPEARPKAPAEARPKALPEALAQALDEAGQSGGDTTFAVVAKPGGYAASFTCRPDADETAVAAAAAKITHYGSYGLLGFARGKNVLKKTLEPAVTPLIREFGP